MSEVISIIMEQIDWRELQLARFKFIKVNDYTLQLRKASKAMNISYDKASDTYSIMTFRIVNNCIIPDGRECPNYYWEMLKPAIQSFFKFEYVMRGLRVSFERE